MILKRSVKEHIGLCRGLHKLVIEQRTLIKNRNLKGLEEITRCLEDKCKEFSSAQTSLQSQCAECLNAMGLATDNTFTVLISSLSGETKRQFSELVQELNNTIKIFQRDNNSNLMLIKGFYQTIGQVLKFYQTSDQLVYGQNGNIKMDGHTAITLNKTV